MHILPFKSAFWCFRGVVVYLSCFWLFGAIWLFLRVDLAFFAYDYLATLVVAYWVILDAGTAVWPSFLVAGIA